MPEEDQITQAINGLSNKFDVAMFGDMENKGVVTRVYRNEEDIADLQETEAKRTDAETAKVLEERKFRRHVIIVLIGGIFSLVTAIIAT